MGGLLGERAEVGDSFVGVYMRSSMRGGQFPQKFLASGKFWLERPEKTGEISFLGRTRSASGLKNGRTGVAASWRRRRALAEPVAPSQRLDFCGL